GEEQRARHRGGVRSRGLSAARCRKRERALSCSAPMPPDRELTLAHSPDPDDAFMHFALAAGRIDTAEFKFKHVLEDIESLNRRALRGEYEITAISMHAYAYCLEQYALLPHGASIGDRYGPKVVAKEDFKIRDLKRSKIAIPGTMTTAYLVLRLALGGGGAIQGRAADSRRAAHVRVARPDAGAGSRRVVRRRDGRAAAAARRERDPEGSRRRHPEDLGVLEAVDRIRARASRRGARARDAIRARPRPRAGRQVRRHVRERLHARVRRARRGGGPRAADSRARGEPY